MTKPATKTIKAQLDVLYEMKEEDISYDDLTPNLQKYADWLSENMPVIRTYAQTKFSKWGGNSYGFALEHVEKHEHPPKLSRGENDFTGLIFDNFRNGVWDE